MHHRHSHFKRRHPVLLELWQLAAHAAPAPFFCAGEQQAAPRAAHHAVLRRRPLQQRRFLVAPGWQGPKCPRPPSARRAHPDIIVLYELMASGLMITASIASQIILRGYHWPPAAPPRAKK